ncbi:YybH family protein [Saccharothrix variisporea]|uniref:YybH family protein n=1 Tax=Saccharothrix variisporea TaxID=543527 RepID=UPI001FE299A6|nr:nuclear transport factor 2 family protein [Saccharothrix variisporea]
MDEIRERVSGIAQAIRDKDLAGLRRLYAEDVVSFDIDPPLQHVGVDAKLKNWERVFTFFAEPTYEVRDLTVVAGEDLAFAYFFGRLSGTLGNGTKTPGMWVRGTLCFRKVEGTWLIAHDQVSVPLDIATGRGVTDLEP